jgi:hypothetical protein
MSLAILDDIRHLFETHAPELQKLTDLADKVDNDPLMQAAQAALGLSPGLRQIFAEAITKADAELTSVIQATAENAHAAGVASAQPAPEAAG